MSKTYYMFFVTRGDGTRPVPRGQLDRYFASIESLTGLDRAMAEAILASGRPIEHPEAIFSYEPVADEAPR